ncbi:MAG TPA: type II toxin-antitoxin system RelE/ParE family toxin [Bryobacteraceae bacterium]|nr:type II toxin-antitoxin system RelE/ParE family toxin [Bryobacteraceae bacterium]
MSWACEFAPDATKDIRNLPKAIQNRVARVLGQMAGDPFQGDVKALQGETWKGVYRRRIGDYRILFTADHEKEVVLVLRILMRSGRTYR